MTRDQFGDYGKKAEEEVTKPLSNNDDGSPFAGYGS